MAWWEWFHIDRPWLNVSRYMFTALSLVVKILWSDPTYFFKFYLLLFFPHTLQCGQIEKLMPYIYQLSLAHAASFYLKCPSFGKRYLKSIVFFFWCKCYFFHEANPSISLFSIAVSSLATDHKKQTPLFQNSQSICCFLVLTVFDLYFIH